MRAADRHRWRQTAAIVADELGADHALAEAGLAPHQRRPGGRVEGGTDGR